MTFHQGLHCFARKRLSLEKEIQYFLEIITCDPSIYTKAHPDFIAGSFISRGSHEIRWPAFVTDFHYFARGTFFAYVSEFSGLSFVCFMKLKS